HVVAIFIGRLRDVAADDLVKQVNGVIKIFEQLHPSSIGLLQFDSSSNHHAMAADSLVASKLNLSERHQHYFGRKREIEKWVETRL
ncbi:hypothetical protein GcC1_060051, partial [Golovinomyces cichoracearum]